MRKFMNQYELKYINKDGIQKTMYPYGEDEKAKRLGQLKARNLRVLSCRKMYPINMNKHQHDLYHLSDICMCAVYDMQDGTIPMDEDKLEKLEERSHRADEYAARIPMRGWLAYFTWDEYKDAQEMIADSINSRMAACERAGIPYVS